jgi:hexosaminidase
MKLYLILLLLISFSSSNQLHANDVDSTITIIPTPTKMVVKKGHYFLPANIAFSRRGFNSVSSSLIDFADQLIAQYHPKKGNSKSATGVPNFSLNIDKKLKIPEEGYFLSINKSGINLSAASEKGIFYGLQTLAQLFIKSPGAQAYLPYLEIEDYPTYAYRGSLLDVGRYFYPVSFIKSYIDLMARYKFNTFHWHLTDDQGWRLEIKKYPKLTTVGAFRSQTLIGHLKEKKREFDHTPHGGFYTQEEIKEIVAYASKKYITVIPEIDMPGHSMAALAAYPELACGDHPGPFKVAEQWGIFEDIFCPGKEKTFTFLQDVLDEVVQLFPSKYIHIGGDEAPKARWKLCKHCQKRITQQMLKDEQELQSYFITKISKYLESKGRRIIGWEEILEGGLAKNATLMSWRGTKAGILAAKQSHDVIMSPRPYYYMDFIESLSDQEPLTMGRQVTLEQLYNFNPIPMELSASEQRHIIGIQGNLWTEYIATEEKVLYMLLPKLLAIGETAWSLPENRNWINFSEKRLPAHLGVFDREGVEYRVPEPIGIKETTLYGSEFTFQLKSPVKGASIFYTLDGRSPRILNQRYESPLTIKIPEGEERILKTRVITPNRRQSIVVTTILRNNKNVVAMK